MAGNRREFLKLMSAALGSAVLSGCGGGGGTSAPSGGSASGGGAASSGTSGGAAIPNALNFSPVISSGTALPGGLTVASMAAKGSRALKSNPGRSPFPGQAQLNDNNQAVLVARDNLGQLGIYTGALSFASKTGSAKLTSLAKVARMSDNMSTTPTAPRSVVRIAFLGMNNSGTILLKLAFDDRRAGFYTYSGGKLQPVLVADQITILGAISRRVRSMGAINDNGDIAIVIGLLRRRRGTRTSGETLVYIPKGKVDQAFVLLHERGALPGTSSVVRTFSSVGLDNNGNILVSGTAGAAGDKMGPSSKKPRQSFILKGAISTLPAPAAGFTVAWSLLAAHGALGATSSGVVNGSTYHHPAMGLNGTTAFVVSNDGIDTLYVNGSRLIATGRTDEGSLSPSGRPIRHISPPAVGTNGEVYVLLATGHNPTQPRTIQQELVVFSGAAARTLVITGQQFSNGDTVRSMTFLGTQQGNKNGNVLVRLDLAGTGEKAASKSIFFTGAPV